MSTEIADFLDSLPFEPEALPELHKRLKKAFAKTYTFDDLTKSNVHESIAGSRTHVLDLPNGFRVVCAVSEAKDGARYRNFLVRKIPEKRVITITEALSVIGTLVQSGVMATAAVGPNATHIMLKYAGFKYAKNAVQQRKPSDGVHFNPEDGTFSGAV